MEGQKSEIKMVDLRGQYLKIQDEINEAIQNVLNHTAFIKGPEVKLFEEELARYLNVKHVISCGNGTDALQLALMALDLKPGDEVIVPAFTYAATAEVIALLQLKPRFVDVLPDTFQINPDRIEKAITPATRAIIPVHLFGQCADMKAVMEIARNHNLFVIEDAAQAIGASFKLVDGTSQMAGCIGDIGTTSFFPSKNLGAFGDGGAIFTNNEVLAEKLRMIANHGQKVQYYHEYVGINSRLDTIQAAILRVKLKYLESYHIARRQVASWYDTLLTNVSGVRLPARSSFSTHIFNQYTVVLEAGDRNLLRSRLKEAGIPSMIYYPLPLHLQPAFRSNLFHEGDFPVSEQLCQSVISLPVHTELTYAEVESVATNFAELLSFR